MFVDKTNRCIGGGLAMGLVAVVVLAFVASAGAEEDDGQREELAECDDFIESYVRSSARKLWRPLSRGGYELTDVSLEETIEIDVSGGEAIAFEIFEEEDGEIVGLADRDREFQQTYVVAEGIVGPIIVSQTWQPRHLRDQGCEPITSAVERPELLTPTVDIQPFEFWGLRAGWRVQVPENVDPPDRELEDVVADVILDFAEDDEKQEASATVDE